MHVALVHVAGQVAQATAGRSVTDQTREILERIARLLLDEGTDKSRLLSANVRLSDMNSFAEMNAVWNAWVTEGQTPGRTRSRLGARASRTPSRSRSWPRA